MCEPLPGAGEWGRTRALHPCCAIAWEHSAPAKGRLCGIKTARRGMAVWLKGEDKSQYKSRKAVAPFLTAFDDGIIAWNFGFLMQT